MNTADLVFAVLYFVSMIVVLLLAVWFFKQEYRDGRSVTLFDLFLTFSGALIPFVNISVALFGFYAFMKVWGSKIIIFHGRDH